MRIIDQRIKVIEQRKKLNELFTLIREFGREEDLKQWNLIQFELWLSLSKTGLVALDDINKFSEFGAFFYNFWKANKKIPTHSEIVKQFMGKG